MSNSSPYGFPWGEGGGGGGGYGTKKILMPNIETSNRVLNVERQFIMPYTTHINTIMSCLLCQQFWQHLDWSLSF